ncbi:PQQ-dependent sugar dehydrogenase [Paenibacillus piri]|uniref:PQQ-dependent sugar dehydrogenase n=1 Tax=Paenibacillus piri TaxID=2547395 RepID=A0A4R5KHI3_9BACL|nr:PQQ-dependent sugar dehydrogenase [Paenibacillus piri]TDF94512.1 PQQ-dependent sugar dehydrogenase [Paenibacillus piri]
MAGLNLWIIAGAAVLLFAAPGCFGKQSGQNGSPPAAAVGEGTAPAPDVPPGRGSEGKATETGETKSVIPYTVETVASKLDVPWDMDFAPDGRIFFTERGGAIRVIEKGALREEPVFRFEKPPLYNEAEAGLLGIALDRDFSSNHYMYVYHSYQEGGQAYNRLIRMVESGGYAKPDKVLLDRLPGDRIHDGGRVKIGPDGLLYITNGDAAQSSIAQDAAQLGGKILRIKTDGTIPSDNPFPGSPVYSLGHRNPQGLAWQPSTGRLFSTEHGQSAHDELNVIEPGANYGWPLVQGDETQIKSQDAGKQGPGPLKAPLLHSGSTTWAPSGIAFVTKGPWQGNLLIANLRGTQLQRVVLSGDPPKVQQVELLFQGELGRIRNVTEGPDGSIYMMTNNRDGRGMPGAEDDRLIRLKPTFK